MTYKHCLKCYWFKIFLDLKWRYFEVLTTPPFDMLSLSIKLVNEVAKGISEYPLYIVTATINL